MYNTGMCTTVCERSWHGPGQAGQEALILNIYRLVFGVHVRANARVVHVRPYAGRLCCLAAQCGWLCILQPVESKRAS